MVPPVVTMQRWSIFKVHLPSEGRARGFEASNAPQLLIHPLNRRFPSCGRPRERWKIPRSYAAYMMEIVGSVIELTTERKGHLTRLEGPSGEWRRAIGLGFGSASGDPAGDRGQ